MNASCEIIQDLLPLYCDGVCSEKSRETVEAHLQTCSVCQEEYRLMDTNIQATTALADDERIAKAAASTWKKSKKKAFLTGCLLVLVSIVILFGAYATSRWVNSANGDDLDALAKQAIDGCSANTMFIQETVQRGNYMAALCTDENGLWYMWVYDRERLFPNRWHLSGGSVSEAGKLCSWHYGSPQAEAVLIYWGAKLSDEICWYTFQNRGVTYLCPVEDSLVLDLFIIPDSYDTNGIPSALDKDQQPLDSEVYR